MYDIFVLWGSVPKLNSVAKELKRENGQTSRSYGLSWSFRWRYYLTLLELAKNPYQRIWVVRRDGCYIEVVAQRSFFCIGYLQSEKWNILLISIEMSIEHRSKAHLLEHDVSYTQTQFYVTLPYFQTYGIKTF